MKSEWRKYAPLGLYIALFAALATGGLYFVRREVDIYIQIGIALTVIGLAAFALLDPKRVRKAFTGRQARYGSNAVVFFLATLGILVVANYLAYENPKRWDLTEDKENTLAAETLEVLESLEEPVSVRGFYSGGPSLSVEQLLDNYRLQSDGKVTYEFIDPLRDPLAAQQAGVEQDRTLILTMGERNEKLTYASEGEITGALIRLMSGESQKIYFLTGHGEYNPEDSGDEGYSAARSKLTEKNYQVEIISLLGGESVPDDAALLIIAGPLTPVTEDEVEDIKLFLEDGGSLIVMEEPIPFTQFGEAEDPLAEYLADEWGIVLGNDMILDRISEYAFIPFANELKYHVITNKMPSDVYPFFPTARSVTIAETFEEISPNELVVTAPYEITWAETDLAGILAEEEPIAEEGEDLFGPVPVVVVAENYESGARIAVFGDSDFAADNFFNQQSNGSLLINTIDWAAEQEELINLSSEPVTQRSVVALNQMVVYLLYLVAVCVVPALLLVVGLVVWYLRRQKG
jgi:ABC-type uncharacterized transport system involved in gliding motility auxiliary subunit